MTSFHRGRLRRVMDLGRLGARVAAGQGRRLLSRDPSAAHRRLADTLVAELGKMKGLPMKIGQILSYMDGVVPDEYQDIYRNALATLRTTSPAMSREAMASVIAEDLGAPAESLFDDFDWRPLASASIGQVYGARHAGREVCVKVQYPGIAEATESDLRNVGVVVDLMRAIVPNIDTRQMIDDFRARLAEECDYTREAEYQGRFAQIYAESDALLVPAVITERSGRRVLTTERIDGQFLEAFMSGASPAECDRAGQTLYRFAFGTLLQHGLFHADPHPGNLLFRADAADRLGVLDYGCVQPIDEVARADIAELLRRAMARDDLSEISLRALGVGEADDVTRDTVVRVTEAMLEPIRGPQPFRFTRGFAGSISRLVIEAKMSLAGRYLTRRGRFVVERKGVMFIVRNLFGLASIWGTLQARGDYRALTEELLAGV